MSVGGTTAVVGVCSWSLRAEGPEDLARLVRETGCAAVQLHLDPIRVGAWDEVATARALEGIGVVSGMMSMEGEDYTTPATIRESGGVRPDGTWAANLAAARDNAALAARLGIGLVTFHAGHLPEDPGEALWAVMVSRLEELAGVFGACGVRVALETGQETAGALRPVLARLRGVGVNFDPANMILYGTGEPLEALEGLGDRVVQLHVKDALWPETAGAWGSEVPVGEGAVDWGRFVATAARVCPGAGMMIEREAGEERVEDVRTALGVLRGLGVPA